MKNKDSENQNWTKAKAEFNKWHEPWLKDRKKSPSILLVDIKDPPSVHDKVLVMAFPDIKRRGRSVSTRKQKTFEGPVCLFDEELTYPIANKLNIALTNIRNWQGIDFAEGLACMTQHFLRLVDFVRDINKRKSILFGPPHKSGSIKAEDLIKNAEPKFPLELLLKFWNEMGSVNAKGIEARNGVFVKPASYKFIPFEQSKFALISKPAFKKEALLKIDHSDLRKMEERLIKEIKRIPKYSETIKEIRKITLEENVFCKEKGYWRIKFANEDGLFPLRKGFDYLQMLIMSPRKLISSSKLQKTVRKPLPVMGGPDSGRFPKISEAHRRKASARQEDIPITLPDQRTRILRPKNYQKIEELEDEYNDATYTGDAVKAAEILDAIEEEEEKGKRDELSSPSGSARRNVSKAIDRAINEIDKKKYPHIHELFFYSVHKGKDCLYSPPEGTLPFSCPL